MNILKTIEDNMDSMLEALKGTPSVDLSGREEELAIKEIEQEDSKCAECGLGEKTHSSYCQSCWHSKMQDN